MKLQLFYCPIACSMVPFINLEEAKADYAVHVVNLRAGDHLKPEYIKVNPKHKVPALVIDGKALTENIAINIWIAKTFPAAHLLPQPLSKEVEAISLLSWFASNIHPALSPNMNPQKYCALPGSEESVKECAQKSLAESFGLADELLKNREWFFDHYTVADAYFFWTFLRATRFNFKYLDLSQFQHCQAHMARMHERASVIKLLDFEKQTLASFGSPPALSP